MAHVQITWVGRTTEQKRKIAERVTAVLIEDGKAKRENIHVSFHDVPRSEEHTSELQSQSNIVCRLLLEKKKKNNKDYRSFLESYIYPLITNETCMSALR